MCLGTLCDGGAPAAMTYEGGQRNCDLDRDHRGVHTDVPTYTCSYRRTGSAQFMPGTWNPGPLRGRADVPELLALAVRPGRRQGGDLSSALNPRSRLLFDERLCNYICWTGSGDGLDRIPELW